MAKKALKKGLFITFEGPEGSGKSTHARLTAKFLRKKGYAVLFTREPGGTAAGDMIRKVLLKSKHIRISPVSETLLFEAARAAIVRDVIKPALEEKKIVISDRFNDATIVYQGLAGGVPLRFIKYIERFSVGNIKPHLTLLLDIDAGKGLGKIKKKKRDRMESKRLSFHRRVRKGYLAVARREGKRVKVVKTQALTERTFFMVRKEVMDVVRKYAK